MLTWRSRCVFVVVLTSAILGARAVRGGTGDQPQASVATVLSLPSTSAHGVDQPFDKTQTQVLVSADADGSPGAGSDAISLPIVADVNLIHGGRTPLSGGMSLALRDARWSQALFRVDTNGLAAGKELHGTLRFTLRGVEKPGQAATFIVYRMLKDWSEEATWTKPFPDQDAEWNGLKAGTDYDAKPIAEVKIDALAKGQQVNIDGLGAALTAWRDHTSPNFGFLLTMNGKALQCEIPSAEAASNVPVLVLGGPTNGKIFVMPNLPLLDQVLLKPGDVVAASLQLTAEKAVKFGAPITIQVFRALRPSLANSARAGTDYDAQAIASINVPGPLTKGDVISVDGLGDTLNRLSTGEKPSSGLLVVATSSAGAVPVIAVGGSASNDRPAFAVTLPPYDHASLFQNALKVQPNVYTVLKDGHLSYGGHRLRLWGVVGYPVADRLIKMGFNAQRVWEPRVMGTKTKAGFYSDESAKRGEPLPYTKGDGSFTDIADKYFSDLKARGMFVMFGALGNSMPVPPLADDDSFIAPAHDSSFDRSDWSQWKEAVLSRGFNANLMAYVDDRLQAVHKRSAKNLLTHVNPYTGKPYGQEEPIAIYEMGNEVGFPRAVLEGLTGTWPAYFQAKLQKKWNQWLKDKYGNDAALAAAWGKVDPGESIVDGTVKAAPDITTRVRYPKARGDDFVHFVIDTTDHWNADFRDYCRTLAPMGVGVNVAPFSFDTRYRPSLPWNYTDSRAEVNSFGMYFWNLDSALTKPPSAYLIDSGTVQGAATVLYETNINRPDRYRAEYPLRMAAMASWQDWDGVFWHYWGPINNPSDEAYMTVPMMYETVTHYWDAVVHENDPVMCSAMAIAGRMFLDTDIHAAPAPVSVEVGKKALYSFDAYNGADLAHEMFTQGASIHFDPSRDSGATINGAPIPTINRLTDAVRMGDQVLWDWPNGRLIIDTPRAKAYVGKFSGPYKFKDGIELGDVNTPFVAFGMVSADGKPLVGDDASKRIDVTAVFDAQNSGFAFNWAVQGGPIEMAKAVANRGHAPIIEDPVDYSIWFPTSLDGHFDGYDFAVRRCESQTLTAANRIAHNGKPLFMGVITIDHRGSPMSVPEIAAATQPSGGEASAGSGQSVTSLSAADQGMWNPMPGMSWSLDYVDAHKFVRDSTVVFSSISAEDLQSRPEKTIMLTDAQLPDLWNSPADVQFNFAADHLQSITATLKQPPPFDQAVGDFEKRFGAAAQKQTGTQYERSLARWNDAGNGLTVTLTESQGTLQVLLSRKGAS